MVPDAKAARTERMKKAVMEFSNTTISDCPDIRFEIQGNKKAIMIKYAMVNAAAFRIFLMALRRFLRLMMDGRLRLK
jgi:hypothetical protein